MNWAKRLRNPCSVLHSRPLYSPSLAKSRIDNVSISLFCNWVASSRLTYVYFCALCVLLRFINSKLVGITTLVVACLAFHMYKWEHVLRYPAFIFLGLAYIQLFIVPANDVASKSPLVQSEALISELSIRLLH